MITADQLVAHGFGDYVLQSDWMAATKTKKSVACLAHVFTYTLPFLLITQSWKALLIIAATHFIIDRWRLARYVVWAKNWLAPWGRDIETLPVARTTYTRPTPPWSECKDSFGYPKDRPPFLAMWLMIIADNLMHVVCNGLALYYFR